MKTFSKALFLFVFSGALLAQNADWQPFVGAERLAELVGGATVEIRTPSGDLITAVYREDGTGTITAGNAKLQRTWEVVGDDQVCYQSTIDREENCYRFEQNINTPGEFRARHLDGETVYDFRVVDGMIEPLEDDERLSGSGSLATPSVAEIAAELSNPNTALGTMNFLLDVTSFKGDLPGAGSASATKLTFQPGMPYPITDTANFFVRPLIPLVIKQDVPAAGGFAEKTFELGDIGYDIAVFNTSSKGIIYGGGVAGLMPTATDDALGLDQWTLGPEVVLAIVRPWGTLGIIASHQWDVAGDNKDDTSITGGQYFYNLNLKAGWVVGAGPTFSYNHEAASGNKLTLPLGIGVTKTTVINGKPWRFGVQYWYYVETPELFGPQHAVRFQVSPVVRLPW